MPQVKFMRIVNILSSFRFRLQKGVYFTKDILVLHVKSLNLNLKTGFFVYIKTSL